MQISLRNLAVTATLALCAGPALAAGNAAAGAEKAAICASCHGQNGVSQNPAFPTLAGQHASYLEIALEQYKDGGRKNPIMQGQAANLSEQDIKDLAAYYAQQQALYTPKYEDQ